MFLRVSASKPHFGTASNLLPIGRQPDQRDQVDILVRSTWTLRRLAVAEAQVFAYQMDTVFKLHSETPLGKAFTFCDRTLGRLQRMVNSTQRNIRDALLELERLQAIGPTADPIPAPAPIQPTPQPVETEPLNQPEEFVSSTPPAAPATTRKKFPAYHKPGSNCYFLPNDRKFHLRCPRCYARQEGESAQNAPNPERPAA